MAPLSDDVRLQRFHVFQLLAVVEFHFAHEQSPHLDHRHQFSDTLPQHHSIFVGRNQFFDVLFEVLTNLKITQEGKYMDKTLQFGIFMRPDYGSP